MLRMLSRLTSLPFVIGIALVTLSSLPALSCAVAAEGSPASALAQAVRVSDGKYLKADNLPNFDDTPSVSSEKEDTVETKRAIAKGPVKAVLSYLRSKSDPNNIPVVTVTLGDRKVAELVGSDYDAWNYATIQIAELDPITNPYPEVVVSFFTGGMHCCANNVIVTSDGDSAKWKIVPLGHFDGLDLTATDMDGDGRYEFAVADQAFIYAFGSYAGSVAPLKVLRLEGAAIKDVTTEPHYRAAHAAEMKRIISRDFGHVEVNPFLAGWVAQKMLLGEGEEAWKLMLAHYDRTSTWGLEDRRTFPDALAAMLQREGYVRAISGVSVDPGKKFVLTQSSPRFRNSSNPTKGHSAKGVD